MARQKRRSEFLGALYDAANGNIDVRIDFADLCDRIGIPTELGGEILGNHLIPKGWAKGGGDQGRKGWASITLPGVEAIEAERLAAKTAREDPRPLDDLLPLYRKRMFLVDLPRMVQAAMDSTESLALVMVDLDHFKRINDEHGHPAGDDVLRAAGEIIRKCVGAKGSAYRYGGEEIAILLPNYTSEEATVLAERMRKQIEGITIGPKQLKVTVSSGIACLPTHATAATTLVEKADEALYDAKNLGRNCVRISGEPKPSKPTARHVVRKEPEQSELTDEEMRRIRTNYFRHRQALCPRDRAILEVHEDRAVGTVAISLTVVCPMCGLVAEIGPGL